MIFISMALVLVGAVTLVIGFFNDQRPEFIYVTIVTSLLAGVFLVFELLRQRPSQKPVLAAGSEGYDTNAWCGGSWGAGLNGTTALEHDDAEYGGLETSYDDDPVAVEARPLYGPSERSDTVVNEPQNEAVAWWTPEAAEDDTRFHTMQLPDHEAEWDVDQVSWQEAELEPALQTRSQPDLQDASASTDPEAERFLAALAPVRGVGPSKQAELLAHFRTVRRLRNASVERLAEVPGISTTLAQRIYSELHS
jgi:hypothetical protein